MDLGEIMDETGSNTPPETDNNWGDVPMQPTDPTGNGFGQFVTGSIAKALDYAIQRDQQNMQMTQFKAGMRPANIRYAPNSAGVRARMTNNPLLMVGAAVVVIMLLKGK